jgi:hypothetical protein
MSTAAKPSLRQLTRTPTERQLQRQIVEGLQVHGYVVKQIGHITKQVRCQQCGHWQTPHVGYGNDPSVPDLLVSHPRWPVALWAGLELKTPQEVTLLGTIPGGRLSPGQRALAQLGRIAIIRSLEDALLVLEQVERRIA